MKRLLFLVLVSAVSGALLPLGAWAAGLTTGNPSAQILLPRTPGYVPPLMSADGPVRILFEGLAHTGDSLQGAAHFSAATLRDLSIVVEYLDLDPGHHSQRIHLYGPDGSLYQQFVTAFEVKGSGSEGPAGVHPETRTALRSPSGPSGRVQVERRFPVGGTWITQHSLYGSWGVEVYLDQARSPFAYRALVLGP